MWKARAPARPEMYSQECQVQGLPQIGHFYKVYQSKKKARRANLAQVAPQTEQDTNIDENGSQTTQPTYGKYA